MLRSIVLAFLALVASTAWPQSAELRLLMLDSSGCGWCAQWDADVGRVYARTTEGGRAPLLRQRMAAPLPEGVALARPARFTPTFVLLRDGDEVGRIEGYPGENFFYGLLQRLIERAEGPAS